MKLMVAIKGLLFSMVWHVCRRPSIAVARCIEVKGYTFQELGNFLFFLLGLCLKSCLKLHRLDDKL